MVEKIDACGKDYTEVLTELGRDGADFSAVVFYLDGEENKGEFDLTHLGGSLKNLSARPEVNSRTLWIVESRDSAGRELNALSVPAADEHVLQLPVFEKVTTPPISINKNKKHFIPPEHTLVDGTTYIVLTWSTTNRDMVKRILAIAQSTEDASQQAANVFGNLADYETSQIVRNVQLVDIAAFRSEMVRQIREGIRLPRFMLERAGLWTYARDMHNRGFRRSNNIE